MLLARQNNSDKKVKQEQPIIKLLGKCETQLDDEITISPPRYSYSQSHVTVEQTEASAEQTHSSLLLCESPHSPDDLSMKSDSPHPFQSPPDPQERQVDLSFRVGNALRGFLRYGWITLQSHF